MIDTATNAVTATIPVGWEPYGVASSPDGSQLYVANAADNTVSVINTATNTPVTASPIPVGTTPFSFGVFIQPAPKFAGTPGKTNCYGQSVSALGVQFGGLAGAATALGFPSVGALQNAILAFCGG
jgi:YVTN family beta-propeller protein